MTFRSAIDRLTARLRDPLPGMEAQALMAPRPRQQWPAGASIARVRHAAGLLLLFAVDDAPHVLLTLRSEQVRHGGQVSLPGGVVEPGETFEQAAIREAREEVSLHDPVRVLGLLTPLDIPVSGFRLHPVLGVLQTRPDLRAADAEVARILEWPLARLFDPAVVEWRSAARGGQPFRLPAFVVEGVVVWGATAMVLAELLRLLGWEGPPDDRS